MTNTSGSQYALWDDIWLPKRPLASTSKTGSYFRVSREKALTMPYIEANPSALCSLIITDHDGGMADEIAGLQGLPKPSYTAMNPFTRSGHIVYALATPVCLTDSARRRPVNFLARIESGLHTILEGDLAYAGRITKNPYHQEHLPLWSGDIHSTDERLRVYTLKELAHPLRALKALPRYDEKEPLHTTAVGRNCALFDLTRRWCYRHVRSTKTAGEWDKIVLHKAIELNETVIAESFTRGALSTQEVHHLARSISRWTWRNIRRTFSEEQALRGCRGGRISKRRRTVSTDELASFGGYGEC